MANIKIFVAHHKPWHIYKDDIFVPIQVWKENSEYNLWILWDNTWDNISFKNSWYCELTAQYRVWKNYDLSNVDYIWFCHYRRFLWLWRHWTLKNLYNISRKEWNRCLDLCYLLLWMQYIWGEELDFQDISSITQKYIDEKKPDIILPKHICISHRYNRLGIKNKMLWEYMEEFIWTEYPEYYKILNRLKFRHFCSCGNMFIMKKDLFLEFEQFQFSLLFEMESYIRKNLTADTIIANWNWTLNERVMWFISEMFPSWFAVVSKKHWMNIDANGSCIFICDA